MPLQALAKLNTQLSSPFYPYGKQCASRTTSIILISLSIVCFLCYPIILTFYDNLGHLKTTPTIDQLDAQFWQFSPHLQPDNQSLGSSTFLIAQQIRITNPERQITHDLLKGALSIQNALTTSFAHVDGKPASLATICFGHRGFCVVHSPLEYWHSRESIIDLDQDIVQTINRQRHSISDATGLSLHPLSVFGNVTLDTKGRFVSADSIVLTVLLHQTPYVNANKIWDTLWRDITAELDIPRLDMRYTTSDHAVAWQRHLSPVTNETLQYMFKLFPFEVPIQFFFTALSYLALFIIVSCTFGKAQLVRSHFGLGFAAVFTAIACHMSTIGILSRFGCELQLVHTSLFSLITIVSTLENVFLLTNAVLIAGCDMQVKEKIGRGLQSVGVPMTATLLAELSILLIGYTTRIAVVKEFCIFSAVALIIENTLQMTFFVAVLAIDVKRAELADLEDRQVSKRLRELVNCDPNIDQTDYCPVQDVDASLGEPKTCAECKHFKTHRVVCALVLCLSILVLALFRSQLQPPVSAVSPSTEIPNNHINSDLMAISSRFWDLVNPRHVPELLQVRAPYLIILTPDPQEALASLDHYEAYYEAKARTYQSSHVLNPYDGRSWIVGNSLYFLHRFLYFCIVFVNIPSLMLCIVLVGIIMWMMPQWREEVLLPILKTMFVKTVSYLLFSIAPFSPWKSAPLIRRIAQEWSEEYTVDGIHLGAISAQEQFDKERKTNIRHVTVSTLSGKHVADVGRLDSNAKHSSLVSCGQDGRIIVWDTRGNDWILRLDSLRQSQFGLTSEMNPTYQPKTPANTNSTITSRPKFTKQLSSARCVKLDQGNKWVAAGFEDGAVRVWNRTSGQLVRDFPLSTEVPVMMEESSGAEVRRTVRKRPNGQPTPVKPFEPRMKQPSLHRVNDRVLAIEFLGTVSDYCHPLIAQVVAKTNTHEFEGVSQNQIVSVHKSGVLREWDILSGECFHTIPTGHKRDITILHVVSSKTPHRKLGLTWVFTASKDGLIKCWQRKMTKSQCDGFDSSMSTTWNCVYTIDEHAGQPITAMASELLANNVSVLVTGTNDGAVKVWNLETGDALCTLSTGGVKRKDPEVQIGGPLLKFSKLDTSLPDDPQFAQYHQLDINPSHIQADHRGPITQVVITQTCSTQVVPDACKGCDTCFSSGFAVASCSIDDTVHVWRLERQERQPAKQASIQHDNNHSLCANDYHQKVYRRPTRNTPTNTSPIDLVSPSISPSPSSPEIDFDSQRTRRRDAGAGPRRIKRHTRLPARPSVPSLGLSLDDIETVPDIEQLGGESDVRLVPVFLGKINQVAGRGLVFCNNMVLAGVRQKKEGDRLSWEAWFASLQTFKPSDTVPGSDGSMLVPVETFDLDDEKLQSINTTTMTTTNTTTSHTTMHTSSNHLLPADPSITRRFTRLFGDIADPIPHQKKSSRRRNARNITSTESSDEDLIDQADEEDARELLPFSAIRYLVPFDGQGFSCDFGNFIKIVRFEERTSSLNRTGQVDIPPLRTVIPKPKVSFPQKTSYSACKSSDCTSCSSGVDGKCPLKNSS
ncbi:hypothetical protein J3Q64DRAFT_1769176 [Phycomyces blakesleeanus]|uniref:Sterol regulatory element-binding protein cleavage-activating protein n=2 Tax=Phycomyces blakesleeanus TaxID=4837 RepID=A0A167LGY9_PHYB8|nr:hypothetical protein PHYBLDRAFT_79884 [Phycomyces blakesleeanus NRRL 1555(-)]OAD70437.1 hypothetical protein PHYBLDRAFT_79884 [Phycomyces blakesleeanus NRRL 1555(-)]|eukprot:XP_018288477.1 hypothetical protein PHYBLDRAFT_79884 [Phycomyces blakesleeanus NRRL 1555(-)]